MNILVVGGGGREHALAWKLAEPAYVSCVYVAPGNAGTATEAKLQNIDLDPLDIAGLATFATENDCALTVIGPEAPLVAGIVDHFTAAGLPCFGPTRGAAQLEGSKSFSKDFLARHHIPTAAYAVFSELDPALAYVREQGAPIVVKADGLAAGDELADASDVSTAKYGIDRDEGLVQRRDQVSNVPDNIQVFHIFIRHHDEFSRLPGCRYFRHHFFQY